MAATNVHRTLGLLSAAGIDPWAGALYHDPLINHLDVLASYFCWSIGVGLSLATFGTRIASSGRGLEAGLLTVGLAAVLLTDRLLLAVQRESISGSRYVQCDRADLAGNIQESAFRRSSYQ